MELNEQAARLEPNELEVLAAEYRLRQVPSTDRTFSIPFADLVDQDKVAAYLAGVKGIFGTSSETAAASLFAKRYAYLTVAAALYAMSRLNKGLDYTLENGWIESVYDKQLWLPEGRLMDWRVIEPAPGQRSGWRERVLGQLFAGNVSLVWRALAKTARISKSVLWENTATIVYALYEKNYPEGATPEQLERIRDDYRYLLQEAPGHLFGEKRNPFQQFNTPKRVTAVSDDLIRVRTTCCLKYVVSDKPDSYCRTCPKRHHGR
ncbi:IucA/IucC family C-terminal-domain containing protein [Paenibacillus sp. FSL M8-0334]|uniref:IucA/IucC family C-terminal-domain containing protein n=1 Tax=Paenibacillus sp. FSL M8-0334 TaxID=2921623 RepID=UPI0030F9A0CB